MLMGFIVSLLYVEATGASMARLLTWFVRRIVPLVFAASTHSSSNKVCRLIHILKGGKIKVVILGVYNEAPLFNLMPNTIPPLILLKMASDSRVEFQLSLSLKYVLITHFQR